MNLLAAFERELHRWYAHDPIPSPTDEQLSAALSPLVTGPPEVRANLILAMTPGIASTLIVFAERAATRARRATSLGFIKEGLLALGLAWNGCHDPRDALPPLGLLYDATQRCGFSVEAVFHETASLIPGAAARLYADFLSRKDLEQIAAVMGYFEGTQGSEATDPFCYFRCW